MPHIGHGLMPGFVQTHAGGVDAFGGQQGFRRQQVGRGKTQAAAAPFAVHHFAGKAVAASQQARGLPDVAPADQVAQTGGTDHRVVHNDRRQLFHRKAPVRAQAPQHFGMAAAAPAQGKIIPHHQTAQMHGQQIATHEFLGRQGGQFLGERQLQHVLHTQARQQFQPPFPAGQRGVGLVRGDDQTRVRPESHQHAGQIILAADI